MKTITYAQMNRQIEKYNQSIRAGLKPVIKKNWLRICLGCGVITISLLTPFTNMFLIPVGLLILGINIRTLENTKRKLKISFMHWLYTKRGRI